MLVPAALKQLLLPPGVVLVLLALGLLLELLRARLLGRLVLLGSTLLLYILSIPAGAHLLTARLEAGQKTLPAAAVPARGTVIVLGAGLTGAAVAEPASRLPAAALRRVLEATRLARLMRRAQLVVCGGQTAGSAAGSEAAVLRDLLRQLGVPAKRIVLEARSKNTVESARAIAEMHLPPPLILVTSARHMERAKRTFAAFGLTTLAAPCDFQTAGTMRGYLAYVPSMAALAASSRAIYEYLAWSWYRLSGVF